MACQYWYDGKWRTETEFKQILQDGLLDKLISENKVSVEGLEIDSTKLKEFQKKNKISKGVTVRIKHKIQTRINNEKIPGTNTPKQNNPQEVLEKASKESGKTIPFILAIKVKGDIKVGTGSENSYVGRVKQQLLKSTATSNTSSTDTTVAQSMQEGVPYMLVPSAYGLYPVRIFSNKIKDTKAFAKIRAQLNNLKNADTVEKTFNARNIIEGYLYRTEVKFVNGKFEVAKYDKATDSNLKQTFDTLDQTIEFLGDQIYRINYTNINTKKGYNQQLVEDGALTTDLFSENGNFFNSSSFVLEAYQLSDSEKEAFNKILDLEDPRATKNLVKEEVLKEAPIKESNTKEDESPLFNTPIDETEIPYETFTRDYKLASLNTNRNGKWAARVVAVIIDGKITVKDVIQVQIIDKVNASPEFKDFGPLTGRIKQEAQSNFWSDTHVIKLKESLAESTQVAEIQKEKESTVKSAVQKAIEQETKVETGEPSAESISKAEEMFLNEGTFLDLVGGEANQAPAIVAENGPTSLDTMPDTLGGLNEDLSDDSEFDRPDPTDEVAFRTGKEVKREKWRKETLTKQELKEIKTPYTTSNGVAYFTITGPDGLKRNVYQTEEGWYLNVDKENKWQLPGNIGADVFLGKTKEAAVKSIKSGVFILSKDQPVAEATEMWSQEKELDILYDIVGKAAFRRGGGTKGTLRIFKDIESLRHYLPKETYEQILEARKHGRIPWGVFTTAGMYLYEQAGIGTSYHEAFHIIFNLAFPLRTRIKLLNEVYEEYKEEFPIKTIIDKNGNKKYVLPTFKELEEFLADKFMEYKIAEEQVEPTKSKQIGNFFKSTYRMLRIFFNPEARINLDNIFEDVSLGVYKNSVKFKNTVVPGNVKFRMSGNMDPKYDNPLEERAAWGYLSTVMDEILANYKKETLGDPNVPDKDAIKKYGVNQLMNSILKRMTDEYAYNKKNAEDTRKTEAQRNISEVRARLLSNLFDIISAYESAITKTIKNNTEVFVFNRSTDFLDRFLYSLKKRGLYINFKGVKEFNPATESSTLDESFEEYEAEGETYEEAWMKGNIEINPQESISDRLRTFFAKIPKYKTTRKDSRKIVNAFGVYEYEDPGQIFKFLASNIANSFDMKDMETKLNNLARSKPYMRDVLDILESNPELKRDLWVNVAAKSFNSFTTVYEVDEAFRVFQSNRKDLNTIIREELITNFLSWDNPVLITKTDTADFSQINQDKVKEIRAKFNKINTAINIGTTEANTSEESKTFKREEILNRIFPDLSNVLKEMNIYVSADDLAAIWIPDMRNGSASWSNIQEFSKTIDKIITSLENNVNPFISFNPELEIKDAEKKSGKTIVEELGRKLIPIANKEIVLSFRNMEGKTVYALNLSGFLQKQLSKYQDQDKLKAYLESISRDPYLKNLPIFEDLQNELNGVFGFTLMDGLTRKGKFTDAPYDKMSDIELTATDLAMFHNNGAWKGGTKEVFLKFPIPSDAPTLPYMKVRALQREEIIDKLVQTAKAEHARIVKFNSDKNSILHRVKNYKDKAGSFINLPFLEGKLSTKKEFDPKKAREIINDFIDNEFFKHELEVFQDKGIIQGVDTNTGEITFTPNLIDKEVKLEQRTSFFKLFLLNNFYYTTQFTSAFSGDQAFYKNTVDYQKRNKQMISPGLYGETSQQETYSKGIILKDSIIPSRKEFVDWIKETVDSLTNINDREKTQIKAFWTAKGTQKDGNNESDGATFVSLDRRKQELESLARWTPELEQAYQRAKKGEETQEDLMMLNPPFKPEKPFVFTYVEKDGVSIPMQIKNSEIVLTKNFATKSPILQTMFDDFEAGKYSIAMFESAIKEGAILNKSGQFSTYEKGKDGKYSLVADAEIIDLKNEDWRLQQETPPHFVDERGNFGSQIRTLILGDLNMDGDYLVGGTTMKGSEVAKVYQELIVENLRTSFEEVQEIFENPDGTINYDRLLAELREEIIKRELGQEYLDALAPIKVIIENKEETRSVLPLYHPKIVYKVESIMNSFFKNRVTKQKINGGALINTTSFGVSEELKIITDPKTGAITYQALLPATSKNFFPKNSETGEVDIEYIKQNAPELLKIVGYRIPTEDKYSMFNIEIVGFTPSSMGGTVILPVEATTMAGLDFDIDKLYFMAKSFITDMTGKLKPIKYYDSLSSDPTKRKTELEDLAMNIISSGKNFRTFVRRSIAESKRDQWLDAHDKFIDAEFKRRKIENEEIKAEIAKLDEEIKIAKEASDVLTVKRLKELKRDFQDTLREEYLPFEGNVTLMPADVKVLFDKIVEKLDKEFNPIIHNTTQARNNRILDTVHGVLENINTVPSILNVGNFDNLKEASARIRLIKARQTEKALKLSGEELIKAADELDDKNFNINYPSTQLELFSRNMMGKALIGIFANHNTHHAKAQLTTLSLKDPINIAGRLYSELNDIYDEEGFRISKKLASMLAAVVDNAKDPISAFLNLNTFTANTIALMTRLGVKEDTIFYLMNQPALVELSQEYFNQKGSLSQDKIFSQIEAKWTKALKKKLEEAGIDISEGLPEVSLTDQELIKGLEKDKSLEYYTTQFAALDLFQRLRTIASELNDGIKAAKLDTVGVGPTNASNFVLMQNQQKILKREQENGNNIVGLSTIFMGGEDQTMIPGFSKYGLYLPVSLMDKIFPSIGKVDLKDNSIDYSNLGNVKNFILAQNSDKNFQEKDIQKMNIGYIDFLASGFPFFDYSQSEEILTNMPNRLKELKLNIDQPANKKYKALVDSLYTVSPNNYSPATRIEFYSTGKNVLEIEHAIATWERMLKESDEELKQFALDLVKYAYFSSGYGFGPYTFAHLIPVAFWSDNYQKANGILDKKGRTFNQYLEKALITDKTDVTSPIFLNFLDQFFRNYSEDKFAYSIGFEKLPSITAKIEETQKKLKEAKKSEEETNLTLRTLIAKEAQNSGKLILPDGTIAINIRKNYSEFRIKAPYNTIPGMGRLIRYFTRSVSITTLKGDTKTVTKLYRLKSINNLEKTFGGEKDYNMAIYEEVSALGSNLFIKEYDMYNIIKKSVVSKLKDKKPLTAAEQLLMDDLASTDAAEAMALDQGPGLEDKAEELALQESPTTITIKEIPSQQQGSVKQTTKKVDPLGTIAPRDDFELPSSLEGLKAIQEKSKTPPVPTPTTESTEDYSKMSNLARWTMAKSLAKNIELFASLNREVFEELTTEEQVAMIEEIKCERARLGL